MTRRRCALALVVGSTLAGASCGDGQGPPFDPADPPLVLGSEGLPPATAGEDYLAEIRASGGAGGYRWRLVRGALPAGLFLQSEGTPATTLSGRPTAGGVAVFTVEVEDQSGQRVSGERSIEVAPAAPGVTILTEALPDGWVASAYEVPIETEHGIGLRWRVQSGSLPPGLELDAEGTPSGTIRGTPTTDGRYAFTVRVDSAKGRHDERAFTMNVIRGESWFDIVPAVLPIALHNVPYSFDFVARGGSREGYRWRVISGELPLGLELAPEGTPSTRLSGVPDLRGHYQFRIEVRDSEGNIARQSFFIAVEPPPPPLIVVTRELPPAELGRPYEATLRAIGGVERGYTWAIVQGALPPGVRLSGGTPNARLAGTPEAAGRFEVMVRVDDEQGFRDEALLTLEVAEGPPPVAITATAADARGVLVLLDAELDAPYPATLQARGGAPVGPGGVRYNWAVTAGGLPPGLRLRPSGQGPTGAGTFEGAPTAAGTYAATVSVFDNLNQRDDQPIEITVEE